MVRKADHTPFVPRPRGQTPVRGAGSLGLVEAQHDWEEDEVSGITGDDEDCGTLMPEELDFNLEDFEELVEADDDDEDDELDGGRN